MRALSILLVIFSFQMSFAKTAQYFGSDGVYMKGYDAVAYFTENKAKKGSSQFMLEHDGTKFHFSSEENKALFTKNPEKYLPEYKGWCAYAMADSGDLVKVDPKTFKIVNGKIYFFYNTFWADTLKKWNKQIAGDDKKEGALINKADQIWQKNYVSHN